MLQGPMRVAGAGSSKGSQAKAHNSYSRCPSQQAHAMLFHPGLGPLLLRIPPPPTQKGKEQQHTILHPDSLAPFSSQAILVSHGQLKLARKIEARRGDGSAPRVAVHESPEELPEIRLPAEARREVMSIYWSTLFQAWNWSVLKGILCVSSPSCQLPCLEGE